MAFHTHTEMSVLHNRRTSRTTHGRHDACVCCTQSYICACALGRWQVLRRVEKVWTPLFGQPGGWGSHPSFGGGGEKDI